MWKEVGQGAGWRRDSLELWEGPQGYTREDPGPRFRSRAFPDTTHHLSHLQEVHNSGLRFLIYKVRR